MASIPLIASHVLHRTHVKKKKRNNNSPLIMLPDSSPNPYALHEIATLPLLICVPTADYSKYYEFLILKNVW